MNGFRQEGRTSILWVLVGVVVIAGAMRAARDILIPVAVAILLSFLLAPLVRRLMKWGLPNVVAVLSTVGIAFTILGVVGWLVSAQFVNLVNELPNHQENLEAKLAEITEPRGHVFSRAWEMIGSLRRDMEENGEAAEEPRPPGEPEPVLVEVQEPDPAPLQLLAQYAAPLLGPVGLAGISAVFVVFILLQRMDLRDRFIKLVSGGNINLATEAVDDATRRITRYLLMQMVINVTYGVPLGIGLYFIGVPNALLWGILATLLRFLPFLGPWIAAIFPVSLAIAVDPGWSMPLMTIGLIIVLELVSNNVIEPWLYGASTGISIVALMFAALVWTWIWGPIGLFLSTPLTVCLLVIGKNVPSLSFLNVILGAEPVLTPEVQMYQRMLAMDAEAMIEQAETFLKSRPLTAFYDTILVPALTMAEGDRHAGTLAERRQQFIVQSTRDLVEELGEREMEALSEISSGCQVICVPAKDEADELTALMLRQLLRQQGIHAEACSVSQSLIEMIQEVRTREPDVICLCAIPPGGVASIRKKCRQLRDTGMTATLIAGVWGTRESATTVQKRLATYCPDLVATTFADTLAQIGTVVTGLGPEARGADPVSASEARRKTAIHEEATLDDVPPEELYDAVTRKLAEAFDVPISLVMILDLDHQFWKSQTGLPRFVDDKPRPPSISGRLLAQNDLLVVEDLSLDARFADDPLVRERGIRFYAGVPLRTRTGHSVGSLCVVDTRPKTITGAQQRLLELLADQLMRRAQRTSRDETQPSDRAA